MLRNNVRINGRKYSPTIKNHNGRDRDCFSPIQQFQHISKYYGDKFNKLEEFVGSQFFNTSNDSQRKPRYST